MAGRLKTTMKRTPGKKATLRKRTATTTPVSGAPDGEDGPDTPRLTRTQGRILAAYGTCGSITKAVQVVGTGRSTHYRGMKHSEDYRVAFEDAEDRFRDLLRDAATHRAVTGVKRLKFHQGQPCRVPVTDDQGQPVLDGDGEPVTEVYEEIEYSDTLLIRLLMARCPEFVDRQRLEHSGPGGGPIQSAASQDVRFTQTIADLSAENLKHLVTPKPRTRPRPRSKTKP